MELSPKSIFQVGFGFWSAKILLSAIQFQLFTILSKNKKMNGDEIANQLGLKCSKRHLYDFLDSLVTLGFLQRQGIFQRAIYVNSKEVDHFLDKNKASYIGGIFKQANDHMYKVWGSLEQSLRTGKSHYQLQQNQSNLFADVYQSAQVMKQFVNSMVGAQLVGFKKFAKQFDFSKYDTLADVGGSGATLSIEVSKQNPHLKCTNFDLSPVQQIAKENITNNGLQDKVFTQIGDFFKEDLPKADILVMGNILHDWGLEEKKGLIKKAFNAVNEGGAFVAIENIIDNERKKNLFGLQMSINMLFETQSGFDYSFCEFEQWVKAAGFTKTKLINLEGSVSAAIAYK